MSFTIHIIIDWRVMYTKETAEELAYFFREDKFKKEDQEVTTVKMVDGWHIFLDERDITYKLSDYIIRKFYFVAEEEI